MLDWIGHHCDIAHWGLANPEFGCAPDDVVGPLTVSATADFPDPKAVWNTATKFRVECQYPKNVEAAKQEIIGDPAASQLMLAPMRAPWSI